MSGAQEKDPGMRLVFCPCDPDYKKIIALVNKYELPVILDPDENVPHTELRVNRGEILIGEERILKHLRECFAHRIPPMPSQTS